MAKIYIEPAKARTALCHQETLERALQALSKDVGDIRRGLNYKIAGREAIDARLRDAINQINKEVNSTKALRMGLEQIIVRYEQAENSNLDRVAVEKMSTQSGDGSGSTGRPAVEGEFMPQYSGKTNSIVDALKSLGLDSSYSYREKIAHANGITDYRGTATQNIALLSLLKQGKLRTPSSGFTPDTQTSTNTATPPVATQPIESQRNLTYENIHFIKQGPITCKASSLAMALNMITGRNSETTASMGGNSCKGINGNTYSSVDGSTYVATYKQDSYVGSLNEELSVIENAISNGTPVIAAVHSTKGGTGHHWVIVVGKDGDDYLIVDPAKNGSGNISDNVTTMSSRGYGWGLTDDPPVRYGYITFTKK